MECHRGKTSLFSSNFIGEFPHISQPYVDTSLINLSKIFRVQCGRTLIPCRDCLSLKTAFRDLLFMSSWACFMLPQAEKLTPKYL